MEVSEERLGTPPQRPTIPKTNHVNVTFDDEYDLERENADGEDRLEDDEYSDEYEYTDTIDKGQYDEEGMLPQPNVSSLRRKPILLPYPTVNHGNSKTTIIKENMNVISSFRLKQE